MREKKPDYYDRRRIDLFALCPEISGSVLDVGCGSGATMQHLLEMGVQDVHGVEYCESACNLAQEKGLRVVRADIEKDPLPFLEKSFDFIIFGDVLEHLYDPWKTLVRFKSFLKDEGVVLASIPNIKNYRILKKMIFRDEFSYTDSGILDFTHIRFFTKKESIKMFESCSFEIFKTEYTKKNHKFWKILHAIFGDVVMQFWAIQFLYYVKKKN